MGSKNNKTYEDTKSFCTYRVKNTVTRIVWLSFKGMIFKKSASTWSIYTDNIIYKNNKLHFSLDNIASIKFPHFFKITSLVAPLRLLKVPERGLEIGTTTWYCRILAHQKTISSKWFKSIINFTRATCNVRINSIVSLQTLITIKVNLQNTIFNYSL